MGPLPGRKERKYRCARFLIPPRLYLGLISSLNSEGEFPGVNCLCNGDIDNKRYGCKVGICGAVVYYCIELSILSKVRCFIPALCLLLLPHRTPLLILIYPHVTVCHFRMYQYLTNVF